MSLVKSQLPPGVDYNNPGVRAAAAEIQAREEAARKAAAQEKASQEAAQIAAEEARRQQEAAKRALKQEEANKAQANIPAGVPVDAPGLKEAERLAQEHREKKQPPRQAPQSPGPGSFTPSQLPTPEMPLVYREIRPEDVEASLPARQIQTVERKRGERPPSGWTISDKWISPDGRPVYEDKNGDVWVAIGESSTGLKYAKLSDAQADRIGTHALTRKQRERIDFLKDNPQQLFNELKKLGIIPAGSRFVKGKKPGEWGYIDPEGVSQEGAARLAMMSYHLALLKNVKAQIAFQAMIYSPGFPAELRDAFRKGGYKAYNQAVIEYNQKLTNLFSVLQTTEAAARQAATESAVSRKEREQLVNRLFVLQGTEAAAIQAAGDYRPKSETELRAEVEAEIARLTGLTQKKKDQLAYELMVQKQKREEALARAAGMAKEATAKELATITGMHSEGDMLRAAGWSGAALMAADLLVPGLYVARHWKDLSAAEKSIYLAIDVVFFAFPVFKAGVAGARGIGTAGRMLRLSYAGRAAGQEALRQLTAPLYVIAHPIGTAKATLKDIRNLAEIFAHPRRIPSGVIGTSDGTIRFRVSETTSPEAALEMRAKLVDYAKRTGTDVYVEIGGQRIELPRSLLMREYGGGLAHATPTGEAFAEGVNVKAMPGRAAKEQGLFVSPEPLPRFTRSSAYGVKGENPLIMIFNRETSQQAVTTDKIYHWKLGDVEEIEEKFLVGFRKQPDWQKLYTRLGPEGTRVEIWLERTAGKNGLSLRQIAKLKAMGILEDARTILREPIRVRGKGDYISTSGLTRKEVQELERILKRAGYADQARYILRADAIFRGGRRVSLPELTRSGRLEYRETRRVTGDGTRRTTEIGRDERGRFTSRRKQTPERQPERSPERQPERAIERLPERSAGRRTPERTERADRGAERATERIRRGPDDGGPERATERAPERSPERPPKDSPKKPPEGLRRTSGETPERGPGGSIESPSWSLSEIESAIAWKQGIGYWAVKAPYGPNDWKFFKEPPPGMKISPSQKTAFETVQVVKGKSPERLAMDLGIMDIGLRSRGGRRPTLSFRRDPRQATRQPITLGGNGLRSRKVGPFYHTRVGGGQVAISRHSLSGRRRRRR